MMNIEWKQRTQLLLGEEKMQRMASALFNISLLNSRSISFFGWA